MRVPHIIPYQGSKRKLAEYILNYIDYDVTGRLFEPFAGSAAITLSAAANNICKGYVIGDKYHTIVDLWTLIIREPHYVSEVYSKIWHDQLDDPKNFFLQVRNEFNSDNDPVKFLYLVARCVKNSIRFNRNGEFNQSPDNRRLGMKPSKVISETSLASQLLKDKIQLISGDFMTVLADANEDDVVYMDPTWQGTSNKKDSRYAHLLNLDSLIEGLKNLNNRNIPFLLSFDGTCGEKKYGKELPAYLGMQKINLEAGRSSQAILLGRNDETIESLYLSPALIQKNKSNKKSLKQIAMFA